MTVNNLQILFYKQKTNQINDYAPMHDTGFYHIYDFLVNHFLMLNNDKMWHNVNAGCMGAASHVGS